MARARRVDAEGLWHHVMNRGSGRRVVFADNSERRYFLGLLGDFEERFGVEVHAYCLMGNHFHLLVRSVGGSLSEAMQHLSANFTRYVNHRRDVDGPIFRGRFHSVPVVEPEHLQVLCRYIHRNPIGVVPPSRLRTYPWSSLPALLGLRARPAWLRCQTVLGWFGHDAARLAEFVEVDECEVAEPEWLGELPVECTDGDAGDQAVSFGLNEGAAPREVLIDLETKLARIREVSRTDIHDTGSGARDHSRLVLALLARDELGLAVGDIADFYGVSASYIRTATTRARRRLETDNEFRAVVELLRLHAA